MWHDEMWQKRRRPGFLKAAVPTPHILASVARPLQKLQLQGISILLCQCTYSLSLLLLCCPCPAGSVLSNLTQLPSELGSAIGPEHVDGERVEPLHERSSNRR